MVSFGMLLMFDNPHNIAGPAKDLYGATILFGFALIAFSMALSTIFTDSKLSTQVGMYILMLPTSLFLYLMSDRLNLVNRVDPTLGY